EAHFERGLALYSLEQLPSYLTINTVTVGHTLSGRGLWLLGYPDRALDRVREAHVLARQLAAPFSLGVALLHVATVYNLRREWPACQEQAEAAIALAREHDLATVLVLAAITRGIAPTKQGRQEEGITQAREGMAAYRASGSQQASTRILASLAEALGQAE